MPEHMVIAETTEPLTIDALREGFRACGVQPGVTLLVHTSLRSLGWVIGGAQAYIQALLQAVGPAGTVMMPTQSWRNLDPVSGVHGSVSETWWPLIREHWPAYDPATTPTNGMGVVAELFRTWPGARRSAHPTRSFAALGPLAEHLVASYPLETPFGDDSPVGRLYDLDGSVLLVGVDHASNTSLHLAEHRARYPGKRMVQESSAILVNGARQWISYASPNLADSHDFAELGVAYEAAHQLAPGSIGRANVRLLRQRPLIDWAVSWLERHRS
jgi:aminoglycoside 3-N-acetyltransferase